MDMFLQITKVDEEKRLVTGRAVQETPDRSGEIFDYATSKPYFVDWSANVQKDSNGKSMGNLRSMHGSVAAGKLIDMQFMDAEKAIDVTAKVVDDNEWQKVLEGVHTGFSIGGRYVNKWQDGELTRYTANPSELSLVDRPCIPSAMFFDVVKADGSVDKRAFKTQENKMDGVTVDQLTDEMAEMLKGGKLNESEMLKALKDAMVAKGNGAAGAAEAPNDNASKTDGSAADAGTSSGMQKANDGTGEMGGYTGGQADPGTGESDGAQASIKEHPVATVGNMVHFMFGDADKMAEIKDVKDGQIYMQDAQGGKFICAHEAISHEIDGATPKFSAAGVMEGWGENSNAKADKPMTYNRVVKAVEVAMKKGMYDVASLAQLLQQIMYMQKSAAREALMEGDGSTLPDQLSKWLKDGGDILVAMVAEEVDELVTGEDDDGLAMADQGDLQKAAEFSFAVQKKLRKYGARHSAKDFDVIQKMHDHAMSLGAVCKEDNCNAKDFDDQAKAKMTDVQLSDKGDLHKADMQKLAGDLEKVTKENTDLKKRVAELEALPQAGAPALKVMDKAEDTKSATAEPKVKPMMKADGSVDDVATMFKTIHQTGRMSFRP